MSSVVVVAILLLLVACAAVLMSFLLPGATGVRGPPGPQGPAGADAVSLFPAFPIAANGTASVAAVNTMYYYGSENATRTVTVQPIAVDGVLVLANATGDAISVSFADGRTLSLPHKNAFYVSVYGSGSIYVQQSTFSL